MSATDEVIWRIIDLGGVVGTFINGEKAQPNVPAKLENGDLIGIGCPENKSCREKGKETFVYKCVKHETDDILALAPNRLKFLEAVKGLVVNEELNSREVQDSVMEEERDQFLIPSTTFEGRNSIRSYMNL